MTQDHSVPGTEPGAALSAALGHYDLLRAGDLLGPLRFDAIHPPLLQIVGALGMLVGGVGVTPAVLGENLVFVPLLALGCYQTAKLVAGPRAGLLAVVFALGSPLLIEQFHVFMVDAPDAALVALAVWLILASERFSRLGFAALAGLAVGLGIETKQQYPLFLLGLLAIVLLRGGGWRNWRGIAIFAAVAFAVGSPWYLVHLTELDPVTNAVEAATPGTLPARLSLGNVTWYLWGALNGLLFAPLFVIAAIGLVKAAVTVARGRPDVTHLAREDVLPELLAGVLVSWLMLMLTPIHVVRYMLPMMVYIAVLGTIWIVRLRPPWQAVATGALVLAVTASTLGATFGVGDRVQLMLTSAPAADRSVYGIRSDDRVVLYATRNFMVAGPKRSGDVLALFRALRRDDVAAVSWMPEAEEPYFFDHYGVDSLAAMARVSVVGSFDPNALPAHVAVLVRQRTFGTAEPCLRLADGTGVWVRFDSVYAQDVPSYCPFRTPTSYGP